MLDGADEAFESNPNSRFSDEKYEWNYGRNSSYSNDFFNSGVTSYRHNSVAAKSNNTNTTFQFRSADSFLKSLQNKPKNQNVNLSDYKSGVKVFHKKFGEGVISKVEEEGEDLKVDIDFEKVGHKRLMAKYAGLEIIK